MLIDNAFSDISPQTTTRLIYLCTYLDYSRQFMRTQKTQMTKDDIGIILNLSKSAFYNFWNEVNGKYIIEKDEHLYINKSANIFRDRLPKINGYCPYQKIFIKTVRSLYNALIDQPHKQKQLGYIFKLLPYVNLEYNIFCTDIFEENIKLIEPLTMKDICNLIGYDTTQAAKLQKELKLLTFDYQGNQEYLISYVDNGDNSPLSKRIFLNPHIVYNGSDYKSVEILGAFCKF